MAYYARDAGNSFIFDLDKPWSEQTPEALPLLSEAGEHIWVLSWSPDGKWLAGTWHQADESRGGLALYSLESREVKKFDFGRDPEWLSDSRRLLFNRRGTICLLDVETEEYHELISAKIEGFPNPPSVSIDNRTIYFSLQTAEADIWMLSFNDN
jgi:Tol biopolymer transport system component